MLQHPRIGRRREAHTVLDFRQIVAILDLRNVHPNYAKACKRRLGNSRGLTGISAWTPGDRICIRMNYHHFREKRSRT